MRQSVNIMRYWPEHVKIIQDYMALAAGENPEINSLWQQIEDRMSDQFVQDATIFGVMRWEKMLNIVPIASDTLDDRKFRIMNRINQQIPYTYRALEKKLEQMCGVDGYKLKLLPGTYQIMVRVSLRSKKQYDEVRKMLDETLPCNLELDYMLLYNQHSTLHKCTHEYLKKFTYLGIREEVLV